MALTRLQKQTEQLRKVLQELSNKRQKRTKAAALTQDDSLQLLLLQLVLHHVTDLDTLCHVCAASSGCESLIQAHIKEYLHDCITEGLQCQEARWQSAVRSGTAGEQQPDEPHQQQELVAEQVLQTRPLEWLCSMAGRSEMSKPHVAEAVLLLLPKLSSQTREVMMKPLAAAGLQLTDGLLVEAANAHLQGVKSLAEALSKHSCFTWKHNKDITGLSRIFAAVILDQPESLPYLFKRNGTLQNLPDLLQVACSYSSRSTLHRLVLVAAQQLQAEFAQLEVAAARMGDPFGGSAPGAQGSSMGQAGQQAWLRRLVVLFESCIRHDGAGKLDVLATLPAAGCIGSTTVLRLLQMIVQGAVPSARGHDTTASIRALASLKGAQAILASEIFATFTTGLRFAKVRPDALRCLLQMPQAQHFCVRHMLGVIVGMAEVELRTEYVELIEDLDQLLSTRFVGRADVMFLLRPLSNRTFEPILNAMTSINLDATLTSNDVADLLQTVIQKRNDNAAKLLLQLSAASQISPGALAPILKQVINNHQAAPATAQTPGILLSLLNLPGAQNISEDDAEEVLQSCVKARCYTIIRVMRAHVSALQVAWDHLDPDLLAPCLVEAFSDDRLTDYSIIDEVLPHPTMKYISGEQLADVVTTAFSARARAKAKLVEGNNPPEMTKANSILAIKVSVTRLSELLQLPAMSELLTTNLMHEVAEMSASSQGDCLVEVFSAPATHLFRKEFLRKLMKEASRQSGVQGAAEAAQPLPGHPAANQPSQQSGQQAAEQLTPQPSQQSGQQPGQSTPTDKLLLRVLSMPFMQDLALTETADLMSMCINNSLSTDILQLLVKLPSAQLLSTTQIDELMQAAQLQQGQQPQSTDYQDVLMQLPNAELCFVCEFLLPVVDKQDSVLGADEHDGEEEGKEEEGVQSQMDEDSTAVLQITQVLSGSPQSVGHNVSVNNYPVRRMRLLPKKGRRGAVRADRRF